ncbi:MAG: mechanosensitive ion channel [Thiobacillus sp.]|nr:mechanosensitive ion channel [Gammaproteobacteria bacterium]MBU4499265.1 mechanosensitive ion channel [Gammaproteobacteria bacterium]MDO9009832.1 mechanosensitive ion channel [Thiobacillus sp.]MDP1925681.1 mechanosensitive ion channel [Thiobacillus sp.]MDP3125803.1 mechanosensitive ion channel [Thiobacillus sp.]
MDLNALLLNDLGVWSELSRTLLRIALILVIAWVMLALSSRVIPMLRKQLQKHTHDPEQHKRLETLGRVLRYIAAVVISLVTVMLVLSELGISIAPILASAGIVGLAIGFGAQSLVKDYFTGFFLLLENQVHQGDVVEVAGLGGLVEEVTLRYIRLRDYEGSVHFIPNGSITTVTNRSRGYAYAMVDIGVAYRENIEAVFDVIREVAAEMRADATLGPLILDDLDLAGVDAWADSAVTIRFRIKVQPLQQWTVKRAFLLRLKNEFDRLGIEIPFPHLTLYPGQARDGSAPPLQLSIQK